MYDFKVKLETITPVHISSGNRYFFYLVKNGSRLNEDDVLSKFIEEKNIIEKIYHQNLRIKELTQVFDEELIDFIKKRNDLEVMYKIESYPTNLEPNKTVEEIFKSNGIPIIPGSTLKGLFLTSWIFDKLKKAQGIEKNKIKKFLKNSYKIFRSPTFPNKLREKINIPNFVVSDCLPDSENSYKIKIKFVKIGTRKLAIEVLDEFVGTFSVGVNNDIDKNELKKELKDACSTFFSNYCKKIEKIASEGIAQDLNKIKENLKENEVLVLIGRYCGFYSKTLYSILKELNVCKMKNVREPRSIRLITSDDEQKVIPGLTKLTFL